MSKISKYKIAVRNFFTDTVEIGKIQWIEGVEGLTWNSLKLKDSEGEFNYVIHKVSEDNYQLHKVNSEGDNTPIGVGLTLDKTKILASLIYDYHYQNNYEKGK